MVLPIRVFIYDVSMGNVDGSTQPNFRCSDPAATDFNCNVAPDADFNETVIAAAVQVVNSNNGASITAADVQLIGGVV